MPKAKTKEENLVADLELLLRSVFHIPNETVQEFCSNFDSLSVENQTAIYRFFTAEAGEIIKRKELALKKLKNIHQKMNTEIETVEGRTAEENLNRNIKNL